MNANKNGKHTNLVHLARCTEPAELGSADIHRQTRTMSALLIDFENIYYCLKQSKTNDGAGDVLRSVLSLIRGVKPYLATRFDEQIVSMDAYADFDRIPEKAQSALFQAGVETHNVLGTDTKNAADMRLCVDALDLFHNRPDIRSFTFMTGDRDYIPVIQYLSKRARIVRIVGFPKSTSGDLLEIVGRENFISAWELRIESSTSQVSAVASCTVESAVSVRSRTGISSIDHNLENHRQTAIRVAYKFFDCKREIYLGPYLRRLQSELPSLSDDDRKAIVLSLVQDKVFEIQQRQGDSIPYSVLLVNGNVNARATREICRV